MIDVEQRSLCSLEQDRAALAKRLVAEQGGVRDVWLEPVPIGDVLLRHGVKIERRVLGVRPQRLGAGSVSASYLFCSVACFQALRPHAKDPAIDLHTMTEEYVTYGHRLEPHISDTALLCRETLQAGRNVLFEGRRARCSTSITAPIRS